MGPGDAYALDLLGFIIVAGFADFVRGDAGRIRQILLNLLSNAAKFTNGGDITVRTAVGADDHVVITVEDTGVGVPEAARERIFDAFEQADTSPTRSHGGTGLGLTLVRRFARLLGGDVELCSTPGEGSRFFVTIPRRAAVREPDPGDELAG